MQIRITEENQQMLAQWAKERPGVLLATPTAIVNNLLGAALFSQLQVVRKMDAKNKKNRKRK